MDNSTSERKWTHERKKLLLEIRLRNEDEFYAKRKKRTVLWEKVLREIKEEDNAFPFSRDDITRKFLNFCVTYRRIKKRNNTSGEVTTTWEFFDEMDEVYGSRCDVLVPEATDSHMENGPQEMVTSSPDPAAKDKKCEVLQFLKEEVHNDKEYLQKLIEIEERKLEVEKQKLEEMRKLRILLSEMVEKT